MPRAGAVTRGEDPRQPCWPLEPSPPGRGHPKIIRPSAVWLEFRARIMSHWQLGIWDERQRLPRDWEDVRSELLN